MQKSKVSWRIKHNYWKYIRYSSSSRFSLQRYRRGGKLKDRIEVRLITDAAVARVVQALERIRLQ
jgi:hypothetical protein